MKTKLINIVLICFLILFSIYLLFILFNSKHNDIYNKMNEMILKEKFSMDHACLNIDDSAIVNKCDTDSSGTDIIIAGLDDLFNKCDSPTKLTDMKCPTDGTDDHVCCDTEAYIGQYCDYLKSIKKLLWGSCLTCEKKKAIIDAVKRSKCNAIPEVPPPPASESSGTDDGSSGDGTDDGSSGDGADDGSSGDGADDGSSGDGADDGSSGDGADDGSSEGGGSP
jgi:hypothetical protein